MSELGRLYKQQSLFIWYGEILWNVGMAWRILRCVWTNSIFWSLWRSAKPNRDFIWKKMSDWVHAGDAGVIRVDGAVFLVILVNVILPKTPLTGGSEVLQKQNSQTVLQVLTINVFRDHCSSDGNEPKSPPGVCVGGLDATHNLINHPRLLSWKRGPKQENKTNHTTRHNRNLTLGNGFHRFPSLCPSCSGTLVHKYHRQFGFLEWINKTMVITRCLIHAKWQRNQAGPNVWCLTA